MTSSLTENRKPGRLGLLAAIVIATLLSSGVTAYDERNIENLATRRVQPAYPPMAQKYRIEGTVTVQVSVSTDGKVAKAEFVRGHNIFRSVSLDAVKRWEFRPPGEAGLNGTVNFVFKLDN